MITIRFRTRWPDVVYVKDPVCGEPSCTIADGTLQVCLGEKMIYFPLDTIEWIADEPEPTTPATKDAGGL